MQADLKAAERIFAWNTMIYEAGKINKTLKEVESEEYQKYIKETLTAKKTRRVYIAGGKQYLEIVGEDVLIKANELKVADDVRQRMARHESKMLNESRIVHRIWAFAKEDTILNIMKKTFGEKIAEKLFSECKLISEDESENTVAAADPRSQL